MHAVSDILLSVAIGIAALAGMVWEFRNAERLRMIAIPMRRQNRRRR